jgi:hypothetical protein
MIEAAARELFAECLAEHDMPYTPGMDKLRVLLETKFVRDPDG